MRKFGGEIEQTYALSMSVDPGAPPIGDGVVLSGEYENRMMGILSNGIWFSRGERAHVVSIVREGLYPVVVSGSMDMEGRVLKGSMWYMKKDGTGNRLHVPFKVFAVPPQGTLDLHMDDLCDQLEKEFFTSFIETGSVRLSQAWKALVHDLALIFENASNEQSTVVLDSDPGRDWADKVRLFASDDLPQPIRGVLSGAFFAVMRTTNIRPIRK